MAIVNDNVITRNTSGGFGKQVVYRQRGDKTIMAKWPTVDKNRKPTPGQSIAQAAFQEAVLFAQVARKNEDLIALYKKLARKDQSVYHAAISDAKIAPELTEPQVSAYTGKPGQQLIIKATDNFMVVSVHCSIITPDGVLLEDGEAIQLVNEFIWVYTVTKENTNLTGTTIRFTAADIPRNETEMVINM